MAWVQDNVHAWSGQMSQVLKSEMPQLVAESHAAAARCNPTMIKQTVLPAVWSVIDKIVSRKGSRDGDLCGVDPLGLLQLAWEETSKDVDGSKALVDLLVDIGHTCLQGDTHRLFFYIRALRLSKHAASSP